MPVPQARFNELLTDIEPSPTTVALASDGHTSIRKHLKNQANFKSRYVDSFLSGSYSRGTSIRPRSNAGVQEKPDVDIIVVTTFTEDNHPDDVMQEVSDALEDDGNGYEVERINRRSVRVENWQADMDIVPVIERWNGGYMIADRETGTWKYTNPPLHSEWSAKKNEEFEERFKPLVKMFKWWRRINPTSKRPKGFVLEVLVGMHAPKTEQHYGEAFAQTLENIYEAYGDLCDIDVKPTIPDPADSSNDILMKVTLPQWKQFIDKVRVYAAYAREAQETDDMDRATVLWRRTFGDRFKATGNAASPSTASTVAKATPVAAGYSFPDAMAAPTSSKPRGFA